MAGENTGKLGSPVIGVLQYPSVAIICGVRISLNGPVDEFTVKVNEVVCVAPLPVPVTVMVYVPAGVVDRVEIISVVEQVGLQLVGEKEGVAPAGKPEAVKETEAVVPDTRVDVMKLVTELP